ncbi:hypothetical protein NPIL_317021 [Nephila pilipes]|uniref:Uncharacterized protein n=1 Tax=Nephila pilipes TaxID=299642 RepID=A0A8X6ILM1_NEPPI|nr:hypothetical protein NPIL_317021 [Nephila pilipes]
MFESNIPPPALLKIKKRKKNKRNLILLTLAEKNQPCVAVLDHSDSDSESMHSAPSLSGGESQIGKMQVIPSQSSILSDDKHQSGSEEEEGREITALVVYSSSLSTNRSLDGLTGNVCLLQLNDPYQKNCFS